MSNINESDVRNCGFRIGGDVPPSAINKAIEEAELFIVIPNLGDAAFATISTDTTLNGGTATMAGLKKAECYIAMALLMRDNAFVTSFGVVQKRDEYSTQVDIWATASYYYSVGMQYLRDVAKAAGVALTGATSYFIERPFKN